jgi:hypothetical protein
MNKRMRRRPDLLDRLLAWLHRLFNPPTASTATVPAVRPRRVRDRVPI